MVSKTSDIDSSSSGGLFGASAAPPGGLFSSIAAGGGDSKETTGLFGQPLFGGGGGSSFSFSGLAANVDTQPTAFKKGLLHVQASVTHFLLQGTFHLNYVREKTHSINNYNMQCKIPVDFLFLASS